MPFLHLPLPQTARFYLILIWLGVGALKTLEFSEAQSPERPIRQGADLLKTDIMGVFAHPDDETGMAATLASYALGKTSVVANVYCTRGEGGGNMVGTQWGPALGHLREAELRDCLSTLGVRYCFFLDRLDWAYTESVAATLEKWNKEATLERLVRLVRELRPDVIVTMNPAPNPGQHGHHQAAGVLATEAFTAAADPRQFPMQLKKEGLAIWQTRKLFYGGGSSGSVTTIDVTQALPQGDSAAAIAARALSQHRSQAFGNFGNSPWLQRPQKFTLVKSFVPGPLEGTDLLSGVITQPLAEVLSGTVTQNLVEVRFPKPGEASVRVEFVPRPAVANYRRWAAAQEIEHVAAQFKADLSMVSGEANAAALELENRSPSTVDGTLRFGAGAEWIIEPREIHLRVAPGGSQTVQVKVTPPDQAMTDHEITASLAWSGAMLTNSASVHSLPHAKAARVAAPPPMESSAEWSQFPALGIPSTNSWQGKAESDEDSSAKFRLAHDGQTLFIEVTVKDDQVVSNIAPDDIKGHWRSDSIEICLDPVGGAEHTMGCYKLGIFPFDSSGRVRAARDADANQGPVEETAPDTRLVSSRTSDGYRIRAAIPFSEIGLRPNQKRFGFNLLVYDGDKACAAPGENINKSRLAWAPRPGVMGRPEDWGRVDLE